MRKNTFILSLAVGMCAGSFCFAYAQEQAAQAPLAQGQVVSSPEDTLKKAANVTLDFKEADITNVLKIISYKAGINIVNTPDVIGNISIRLVDVPWEVALDVILKTYGYGYQRQGNVILVTKAENVARIQADEPLKTEVVNLKFLDAVDAEKILLPLLSPRGKISVLYSRGQKGWDFGSFQIGKESTTGGSLHKIDEGAAKSETVSIERNAAGELISKKAEFQPSIKSKILVITDTSDSIDRIMNTILPQIDKKPKQIIIEARIMEVSRSKLMDMGLDYGTGTTGAEGTPSDVRVSSSGTLAGSSIGSGVTPSLFSPLETGTTGVSGAYPFNTGLQLLFKKISGTNLEVILHALEEDAHTNTLSSPRILTLDNQEAAILVGYHTPILSSSVSASTTAGQAPTVTQTLDYYQEIGIRLNVVPQVSEEGFITMLIHPSITSSSANVYATNQVGGANPIQTPYPIIDVREAQTQVIVRDGETIVIGGLLKDVKSKEEIGIPFLGKIPFIGALFKRQTHDTTKIDLLIFITARVVKEGEFSADEIVRLEKGVGLAGKEVAAKEKAR